MATTEPITTAEQLLHASGLGPCELVRGELILLTLGGLQHGCIAARLLATVAAFVKEKSLGVTLAGGTVSVHHSPNEALILGATETLTGGDVLPGLSVPVAEIFAV